MLVDIAKNFLKMITLTKKQYLNSIPLIILKNKRTVKWVLLLLLLFFFFSKIEFKDRFL